MFCNVRKWAARTPAGVMAAVAAACCLSSCGGSGGNDGNPTFRAYRQQWERTRPRHYRYTFQRSAFGPVEGMRKVIIEVDGKRTISVTPFEVGQQIAREAYEPYDTIDELFDRLDEADRQGAYEILTAFDFEFGYPAQARIDYNRQAQDDENAFQVTQLEALE